MAVLVILIATPGLSEPVPEPKPFLPAIAAAAGLAGAAVGGASLGVSGNACQPNCWLNNWRARDRKCGGGDKFSYGAPIHGTCYCCN